ncbi:MAG: STAS-like domain-containing protein [Candidatus Binatia bacterium]
MTSSSGVSTKLKVKDICGTNTVTRKDGKKIHRLISDQWVSAERIEIDFANLEIASVSFLDEAIGQLALRFTRTQLVSKLKLQRISVRDRRLLNDIIQSRYRQKRKAGKKSR